MFALTLRKKECLNSQHSAFLIISQTYNLDALRKDGIMPELDLVIDIHRIIGVLLLILLVKVAIDHRG